MNRPIRVALAGNPNIGKTTLLNALTGSNYSVGNWAGVTVEKKEGMFTYDNQKIIIVDLPGTYSLSAYSLDEKVARDYIINEHPDVIINIVDASNLERNLYLTMQLLELDRPLVIALNMMDEASKLGIEINIAKLSEKLGVPVVPIVAAKKEGINNLLDQVIKDNTNLKGQTVDYGEDIESLLNKLTSYLDTFDNLRHIPNRWLALKILEEDENILSLFPLSRKDMLDKVLNINNNKINEQHTANLSSDIANYKYQYISSIVSDVVNIPKESTLTTTNKIDRILTHKYLGLPIFALIMFSVFYFTFDLVGNTLQGYVETGLDYFATLVSSGFKTMGISDWLHSLIVDGIMGGVFGIISFLPHIACLFISLTILEDSGYMARVAFIMDRLMRQIGLSGKAIIPMLLGFGCNVPAIMGTRTLENENDRLTAILINPFMSCSARLPIYTLFAAAFFPGRESLVIFSLYILGIVVAITIGLIFKKTIFKTTGVPFIMELPPYRLPRIGSVLLQVWEKIKGFLIKAGTVIFAASAILWLILEFNFSGPAPMNESIGAMIGKAIAPIFTPIGFGTWEASLSLLSGVVAKEVVVSNMSIIYGLGEGATSTAFASALGGTFTSLSAYSFMVFTLLYVPCIATIGIIKRETNSWKWMWFSVIYQFLVAWGVAYIIYNIGHLLRF